MATGTKKLNTTTINSIIGVSIMILFRFLPINLPGITPVGMEVIGIFIGALYLWSTVDPLWSSLFSVFMIGFSSYAPMKQVLGMLIGNAAALQTLFMMLFTSSLLYYGITKYIVRGCLSFKFTNGKPWGITSLLIGSTYFMASFVGPFAAIFLFMPIMYEVYKEVGFTKDEAYVKITLVLVVVMSVIGSTVAPYRSATMALLFNYQKQAGSTPINDGFYFIYTFGLGLIIFIVSILVCKYILRPNVEPLKALKIQSLQKEKLPPMTKQQKIITIAFFLLIFFMLFPALLSFIPLMKFLSGNSPAVPLLIVAILSALTVDGIPVFEFKKVMAKQFSWGTYFLTCTAIFFGIVLTNDSVGLVSFLTTALGPILSKTTPVTFIIAVLLISILLTNFSNSMVIGLILIPVVSLYAQELGLAPAPIVMLLTFTVLSTATLTPGASPYAAIMFGNSEWLKPKDIYKYASIFLVVQIAVIFAVGIPLLKFLG